MLFGYGKKKDYDKQIYELEMKKTKLDLKVAKEQKIGALKAEIRKTAASRYPMSQAIVKGVGKALLNIGKSNSAAIMGYGIHGKKSMPMDYGKKTKKKKGMDYGKSMEMLMRM